MKRVRIIPRLDIKGPHLVKGIHLEGLRVLGKPEDFAKFYYENGADELIFQDVVASLLERNSLDKIIKNIAKEIFIPLTVGGGIRSLDDIQRVLRCGADKVSINTAAIKNPDFIKKAVNKFGSSTISATIEAIKQINGKYFAFYDNGRESTNIDVFEWSSKLEMLGVGELIITSVDKEGTGSGFDLKLVKKISENLSIPLIAHGGIGTLNQAFDAVVTTDLDALTISSMFHYNVIKKDKLNIPTNSKEGNFDFLRKGVSINKNHELKTPQELKDFLISKGVNCRI